MGKPSSNKVKQLGTALLKLQLELLVDSMPKTGSHSTEVVYHPPSSQHKEDKKDGHTSGSTEHITTRSGKHSMAASGHGQRGGTGMQMGDISQ